MNKEEIKIITLGDIFRNLETEEQAFEFLKYIKNLQQENQSLKKQLEEAQENIILLKASKPMLEYKKALEENQQKEFIEYLENCINELKKESMNKLQNTINLGIVDITKEILSKYKEIIGVSNDSKK